MQTIPLGNSDTEVSRLVYGCMRLVGDGSAGQRARGKRAILAAVDAGYTIFDHADIYAGGECESLFGEVLAESPALRDQLFIVSKCGIRFAGDPDEDAPQRYDFSRAHIVRSVEASLSRLRIERLDLLLLHRPDYLFDAREVAATLVELEMSGKVRRFGVSNFSPSQVLLLNAACELPIEVNQLEINLHRTAALTDGTLDQCQRLGMTPQAWSPLAGAVPGVGGKRFSADDTARIRAELLRQAKRYGVEDWLIALAWLLRHPARIAPVVGTTTPERIHMAVKALDVDYSREDWYRLLEARNGHRVA
ncbi:MAG: aldo/keto reductase [Pseudomonadota bacterium]